MNYNNDNNNKSPIYKSLDTEIKGVLENNMGAQSQDIIVNVVDKNVQLTGFVENYYEKNLAENLINNIENVGTIENNLTISIDGGYSDKKVEENIRERLFHSSNFNNLLGVGVKVHEGVATLMGEVDTLDSASYAKEIASNVRGIKDVVSNIKISTAYKIDDITINNNIKHLLNKEDIDDKNITADVSGGIVTLKGFVQTRKEVEFATELVMGLEGVTKVRNKLRDIKK